MAAEDSLDSSSLGVRERAIHNPWRHASHARVQTIYETRHALTFGIEFLDDVVEEKFAETDEKRIALDESVELVTMDGQMPFAGVIPDIALVHGDANQVRHYVGQSKIVIAFDPYHFHFSLGIG